MCGPGRIVLKWISTSAGGIAIHAPRARRRCVKDAWRWRRVPSLNATRNGQQSGLDFVDSNRYRSQYIPFVVLGRAEQPESGAASRGVLLGGLATGEIDDAYRVSVPVSDEAVAEERWSLGLLRPRRQRRRLVKRA